MASSSSTTNSSASSGSGSGSPCAACKFLRRKCLPGCVFAPYFPPEEPQKFANVHKVFGASNVTKLLNELLPHQREDAVSSLAYEAEARVKDPVYGCVGAISVLQRQVQRLQKELDAAHADLLRYACGDVVIPTAVPVTTAPPPRVVDLGTVPGAQLGGYGPRRLGEGMGCYYHTTSTGVAPLPYASAAWAANTTSGESIAMNASGVGMDQREGGDSSM